MGQPFLFGDLNKGLSTLDLLVDIPFLKRGSDEKGAGNSLQGIADRFGIGEISDGNLASEFFKIFYFAGVASEGSHLLSPLKQLTRNRMPLITRRPNN